MLAVFIAYSSLGRIVFNIHSKFFLKKLILLQKINIGNCHRTTNFKWQLNCRECDLVADVCLFGVTGIIVRYSSNCCPIFAFGLKFSSSWNGPSDRDSTAVSSVDGGSDERILQLDGLRQGVNSVCQILESGPWGPSMENALSVFNKAASDRVSHRSSKETQGC